MNYTETTNDSEPASVSSGDASNSIPNAETPVAAQQRVLLAPPPLSIGPDGKRRCGHPSGHSQADRSWSEQRLYELRNHSHLSQQAMAAALGVKLSTYQAWEYGKTKDVPAYAWAQLRVLRVDSLYDELIKRYGGKSARDIALDWSRRMDIPDDRPTELARALGVDSSTTCRWLQRDGHVAIAVNDLVTYERRVRREERYLRSSDRRHPGWRERGDGSVPTGQRRNHADEAPAGTARPPGPEAA